MLRYKVMVVQGGRNVPVFRFEDYHEHWEPKTGCHYAIYLKFNELCKMTASVPV